ncbi:unnamed protein product [Ascophyllum nodosum]
MGRRSLVTALAAGFMVTSFVEGFYLPGVAPATFGFCENVDVKVNKLTSVHTQLPLDYYSMPFCTPEGGAKRTAENLGEFLTGDRIETSSYTIFMQHNISCSALCKIELSKEDANMADKMNNLQKAIRGGYRHNWIIDNLPAASLMENEEGQTETYYAKGFPVGTYDREAGKHYVNNHVHMIVDYHPMDTSEEPSARVVGFKVEPISIKHKFQSPSAIWSGVAGEMPPLSTCDKNDFVNPVKLPVNAVSQQEVADGETIIFTYDVAWKESDTHWASRWDIYLTMNHAVKNRVHWFSIVNSLLIVLFLTAMIAMILLRNLHRDIMHYNRVPTDEEKAEEREETGWKLVHADVFRPPTKYPMLFCVLVGTGVQLLCMGLVTICFSAIGFVNPANRGSLAVSMLLLYVLMGVPAGYCSSVLYKSFKGRQWQQCTLWTALMFPSACFLVFLVLNLISQRYHSTQAVPFMEILEILSLWFCISVPMVFLGAYFGYRKPVEPYPVVTSNIPRQIPDQPWFLWSSFTIAVGGILPYGAVFIEMFFILQSLWMGNYYYVFGFLLLVFLILIVTCADIAMVFCYFQLCAEDYHWWWRSFLTSGSTGVWVFAYSAVYFTYLQSTMLATYVLYFGYMALLSLGLSLLTGCIGFYSCLWFTRKIYSSIKVD